MPFQAPIVVVQPTKIIPAGAQFTQAVTADTSLVTASMVRQTGKIISVTLPAATATIVKSVGKTISVTLPAATATIVKSVGKTISVTLPPATASIVKQVGKTLSATAPITAAITPVKAFLVTLTATVTSSALITTIQSAVARIYNWGAFRDHRDQQAPEWDPSGVKPKLTRD